MASRNSSSRRQSGTPYSSPDRNSIVLLGSEEDHLLRLNAAKREHDRVREEAIAAYKLHQAQEEFRRVQLAQQVEIERLQLESQVAEEQKKLRALKAQSIPQLPPEPEPAPRPEPPKAQPPIAAPKLQQPALNGSIQQPVLTPQKPPAAPVSTPSQGFPTPATPSPFVTKPTPSPLTANATPSPFAPRPQLNGQAQAGSPFAKSPLGTAPTQTAATAALGATPSILQPPNPLAKAATAQPTPSGRPISAALASAPDRYVQIHQALKQLRKDVVAQSKSGPLKGKLGDLRREIRKSIGQLTDVRGANTQPVNKIITALKLALDGPLTSTPVDASLFVVEARAPTANSALNDDTLPSLFIYLLNMLSKAIINQFINECSAKPETADPIGVVTAQIFSQRDFQWRGRSLIDVLMAKFRVVCPVLFGYRGSDQTAAGRLAIGWRAGVDERMHNNRMVGLGAGFASIALRDFSKANKANPFPPVHYWRAMASIVNTAAESISDTQLTVLKAMIDGHETRFITFYGNAAVAALRAAVVDFPARAPRKTPPVAALVVLGEVMKRDKGLILF